MHWFTTFLAEIIMIPYVGWGVYTLRRRYRHHDDFSLSFEAGTVLGVGLLFILEVTLLRVWATRQPLLYLFALLGLSLATISLYGHVAISLASRLLVDMVLESDERDSGQPRFGPAESLEREKDFQGALQEYMVLARIYPSNPIVLCRVGENLLRLERYAEAVPWFERALRYLDTPNRACAVATRSAGTLHRDLGRTEDARVVLELFMERFPGTPDAQTAQAFLAEMAPRPQHKLSEDLSALEEDEPARPESEVTSEVVPDLAEGGAPATGTSLMALETAPIQDPDDETVVSAPIQAPKPHLAAVAPMDTPITDDADVDSWDDLRRNHGKKPRLTLEILEDAPPKAPPKPPEPPRPHSSLIEPMDPGETERG